MKVVGVLHSCRGPSPSFRCGFWTVGEFGSNALYTRSRLRDECHAKTLQETMAEVMPKDPLHAASHPRPQLARAEWFLLDGEWDFAIDHDGVETSPERVPWNARIRVPYAPETAASGIADTGFYKACWYRRSFQFPELQAGDRLLLHFGAVDYVAG